MDIKEFKYNHETDDLIHNGEIVNKWFAKTYHRKSIARIIYEVIFLEEPSNNLYSLGDRVTLRSLQFTPEFTRRNSYKNLYKGVSYHSRYQVYQAHIKFDNSKLLFLGNFEDEIKAKEAYDYCLRNNIGIRFTGKYSGKILYKG